MSVIRRLGGLVRRRILARLLAVTCLGGAATVATVGFAAADAQAGILPTFGITQNLLPGLAKATDLGAAPATTHLSLTVSLARPNPSGEKAFIAAAHDPASATYGTFLTPAQFAAKFGVPAAKQDAVRSYLTSGGLTVDAVSAAGDQFSVSGDVAHVASVFHTSFHRYSSDGQTYVANRTLPYFPWGLGITNVAGLNTLQAFSLPARSGTAQDTCLGSTCVGLTTPQDMWTAYEQPAEHTGQDQGLAVFGEGQTDNVIADLRLFEAQHGLPEIPVEVKHPEGDTDFSANDGQVEWNMDTQASSGMAPDASKLTLYFGQDLSDADVLKVFSQFTDDADGPLQASASYGECEQIPVVSALVNQPLLASVIANLPIGIGLGNNLDTQLSQVTQQAAAEGKTVFVSSGDTGSSCPVVVLPVVGAGNGLLNQAVPVPNSPAALPYVVAVGGTVLYTDGSGNRSREYGWAYSGGGDSLFTPQPDYQKGSGAALPCLTTLGPCRGVPDVAAQSGDILTNGYGIIVDGAGTTGGGTSLSAPLQQGMWARVQSAAPTSDGFGFANYAYYRAAKSAYAASFFDPSSTDLSTGLPAVNGAYATVPGYDYVTGLGVPRVSGLIATLRAGD